MRRFRASRHLSRNIRGRVFKRGNEILRHLCLVWLDDAKATGRRQQQVPFNDQEIDRKPAAANWRTN